MVGQQEKESGTVNIRNRDDQKTQAKGELIPLGLAIEELVQLRDQRRLVNKINVGGAATSDSSAQDSALAQASALKVAEAKIAELIAKLKKAGLDN